jgi:hypothetical protein
MKKILLFLLISIVSTAYGQDKKTQSRFNRLKAIKGTEYVIASIDNYGKILKSDESLLIINSRTGQTTPVNIPDKINVVKVKQVRIDSIGVNYLVITAQVLESNRSIFDIQTRVYVVSPDGRLIKQLTDEYYYAIDWVVNKKVGSLVITGQTDSNQNRKLDSYDKNEILIYDLRSLTRIGK